MPHNESDLIILARRRAQADLPLEKVYADWPESTESAPQLTVVKELFDSGVTMVNIHFGQPYQPRVIDFYGKDVLLRLTPSKNNES